VIPVKYNKGQKVFVNIYGYMNNHGNTIEVEIDSVEPRYCCTSEDSYFEFAEENMFDTFEEAQKNLKG
jgi:hypothetical protein